MSYGYEYEGHEGYDGAGEQPPSEGRGRRRRPAQEPEPALPQPQPAYYDAQWEQSGLGWDPQVWNKAQREQYPPDQYAPDQYAQDQHAQDQYSADEYASDRYTSDQEPYYEANSDYRESDYYAQDQRAAVAVDAADLETDFEPLSESAVSQYPPRESAPEFAPSAEENRGPVTSGEKSSATPGQGAFGAAGLAVVTGITALVATPVLAIVVGLSQIGVAVGWLRTVGTPNARRTTVFVAAIGLAAAALAYRLVPDRAPAAMGAALGVGFIFLAADQLFRKDTGAGRHRSEALAAAVTGAAFTVLPAGYLVAQRQDSALAGACALAAAVAVLCSALVGGGAKPIGIAAGVVAATALGALTAVTLSASAGAKGGALGGLISGLFAVIGARTADRLGSEGGDVRISAQALPVAYSAIGAVIAAQVLR
ncbi:hypothetical protein [Actinocrinis sp.]|uniref:hypothetical protein n=1 Tax=Actinocrinis sp. TaxID=1920516 RepID=UPI002D79675E|nr:hypothetical protein [Actinocrinis sp.]